MRIAVATFCFALGLFCLFELAQGRAEQQITEAEQKMIQQDHVLTLLIFDYIREMQSKGILPKPENPPE